MIEEAVAAVKETEGQTDELLRQAGQDSAELLKEAKAQAEARKAQALEAARERAAARMAEAKAEGERLLAEEEDAAVREAPLSNLWRPAARTRLWRLCWRRWYRESRKLRPQGLRSGAAPAGRTPDRRQIRRDDERRDVYGSS